MSGLDAPHPDLELVHRVLAGEPDAKRVFVERMRVVGRLLSVRNARSGSPMNEADLQDLAQDVLLLVWRKLGTYAGKASLETWVYRFCMYEFLNALRSKGRQAVHRGSTEELENLAPRESEPSEPDEMGESVLSFLEQLGTREAEILRCRHVEGLSSRETSELLGVSISTVKTHYYRGLEKLRGAFCGRGGERS